MTDFLGAFNARLATYAAELEEMQARNASDDAFAPSFWLEKADFTLARDVFVAACGSIGHEVTKFSLVYSGGKEPGTAEAASICKALDKPCEQLVAAARVALYSGVGPSLAAEIVGDALRLVKSVRELGVGIEAGELAKVPQLTGRVWEYSVARVSKSNCVATKRSMLQCVTMLNSTIEELKELLEEQDVDDEEDALAAQLEAVELEGALDFDARLSAAEKSLFESGLKLLTMTCAVLKRGVLTLKKYTAASADGDAAFLRWTALLDRSYGAMKDPIVDLGAALYPPIDVAELSAAVESVEQAGMVILAKLLAEPDVTATATGELERGRNAFAVQVTTVKSQIEAAR
ncbi:hypothetical protein PybrP1_004149 [[Pythium] brassicae (nom. inval.)]|nr:hypothetical protein PybrP1_004149 [[Pythium] brassicae (nom. inval.)]